MNYIMKSAIKYFVAFIFLITLILLINSKASLSHRFISTNNELTMPFNDGWEYRWEGSEDRGSMTLPSVVKGGKPNDILWISNIIPDQKFDNAILFLRTSQQYLKVYIDGMLIYNYETDPNKGTYILPGSSWHLIKLPQFYAGKKVEITIVSPYKQYAGNINSIYIGSGSSIILDVIFEYSSILVISCIILFLGIMLILIYYVLKSDKSRFRSLFYLGAFSFLSGIWIACESKIIQFIINSPILIFYLACISLFLLPIPLLLFILTIYNPRKSNILKGFVWVFSSFFIIVSVLQLLNKGIFINSLFLFHAMLLICIITIMYISISEMRTGNKDIRLFFFGCIILCLFAIRDMYFFYFSNIPGLNAQGYLQFAVLLFILLLSASLGHYILEIFNEQIRSKVYKILAYTDILTGLKNRTSFEEMMSRLNENLWIKRDISMIMFDLNNLKSVNDSLGHKEGDRLICNSSRLISNCFEEIGEVYRLGGDEFVVVVTEYPESTVADRLLIFNEKLNEYNSQEGYVKISMAYGMASFNKDEDKDLYSVLVRTDGAMYECKRSQKQNEAKYSVNQ